MRRFWWLGIWLLWVGTAQAATVGQDTFIEAADTDLESHTPTCTGTCGAGGWTVSSAGNLDVIAAQHTVVGVGTTTRFGRKEDDIGDDNMDVTVRCKSNLSSSRFCGLMARMSNSVIDSGYSVRLRGDGTNVDVEFGRWNTGTFTQIGSTFQANIATNTFVTIKLSIRTGTQDVYLDTGGGFGSPIISATEADSQFAGNNYAGIVLNSNTASDIRCDDFHSESVAAAPDADFFSRRRGF